MIYSNECLCSCTLYLSYLHVCLACCGSLLENVIVQAEKSSLVQLCIIVGDGFIDGFGYVLKRFTITMN